MFDRLLAISLGLVALGVLYACLRAALMATILGARGTALVWRVARSRRVCPDCRRLGERCPWCRDDAHRAAVGALALVLPVLAWPLMLRSHLEFSPRAKWVVGLWAVTWVLVALRSV